MKKGKITAIESSCLKGMIADGVSIENMCTHLNRSNVVVEKEVIVEKIVTKEVKDEHLIEELEKLKKEIKEKNMLIQEQKTKMEEMEDVLEHFKKVTVNRRAKYLKTSNLKDTYID